MAECCERSRMKPLAEGVGFEPTIRFPVYTLSKRAPSATRPSLRKSKSPRPAHYSRDAPSYNHNVRTNTLISRIVARRMAPGDEDARSASEAAPRSQNNRDD